MDIIGKDDTVEDYANKVRFYYNKEGLDSEHILDIVVHALNLNSPRLDVVFNGIVNPVQYLLDHRDALVSEFMKHTDNIESITLVIYKGFVDVVTRQYLEYIHTTYTTSIHTYKSLHTLRYILREFCDYTPQPISDLNELVVLNNTLYAMVSIASDTHDDVATLHKAHELVVSAYLNRENNIIASNLDNWMSSGQYILTKHELNVYMMNNLAPGKQIDMHEFELMLYRLVISMFLTTQYINYYNYFVHGKERPDALPFIQKVRTVIDNKSALGDKHEFVVNLLQSIIKKLNTKPSLPQSQLVSYRVPWITKQRTFKYKPKSKRPQREEQEVEKELPLEAEESDEELTIETEFDVEEARREEKRQLKQYIKDEYGTIVNNILYSTSNDIYYDIDANNYISVDDIDNGTYMLALQKGKTLLSNDNTVLDNIAYTFKINNNVLRYTRQQLGSKQENNKLVIAKVINACKLYVEAISRGNSMNYIDIDASDVYNINVKNLPKTLKGKYIALFYDAMPIYMVTGNRSSLINFFDSIQVRKAIFDTLPKNITLQTIKASDKQAPSQYQLLPNYTIQYLVNTYQVDVSTSINMVKLDYSAATDNYNLVFVGNDYDIKSSTVYLDPHIHDEKDIPTWWIRASQIATTSTEALIKTTRERYIKTLLRRDISKVTINNIKTELVNTFFIEHQEQLSIRDKRPLRYIVSLDTTQAKTRFDPKYRIGDPKFAVGDTVHYGQYKATILDKTVDGAIIEYTHNTQTRCNANVGDTVQVNGHDARVVYVSSRRCILSDGSEYECDYNHRVGDLVSNGLTISSIGDGTCHVSYTVQVTVPYNEITSYKTLKYQRPKTIEFPQRDQSKDLYDVIVNHADDEIGTSYINTHQDMLSFINNILTTSLSIYGSNHIMAIRKLSPSLLSFIHQASKFLLVQKYDNTLGRHIIFAKLYTNFTTYSDQELFKEFYSMGTEYYDANVEPHVQDIVRKYIESLQFMFNNRTTSIRQVKQLQYTDVFDTLFKDQYRLYDASIVSSIEYGKEYYRGDVDYNLYINRLIDDSITHHEFLEMYFYNLITSNNLNVFNYSCSGRDCIKQYKEMYLQYKNGSYDGHDNDKRMIREAIETVSLFHEDKTILLDKSAYLFGILFGYIHDDVIRNEFLVPILRGENIDDIKFMSWNFEQRVNILKHLMNGIERNSLESLMSKYIITPQIQNDDALLNALRSNIVISSVRLVDDSDLVNTIYEALNRNRDELINMLIALDFNNDIGKYISLYKIQLLYHTSTSNDVLEFIKYDPFIELKQYGEQYINTLQQCKSMYYNRLFNGVVTGVTDKFNINRIYASTFITAIQYFVPTQQFRQIIPMKYNTLEEYIYDLSVATGIENPVLSASIVTDVQYNKMRSRFASLIKAENIEHRVKRYKDIEFVFATEIYGKYISTTTSDTTVIARTLTPKQYMEYAVYAAKFYVTASVLNNYNIKEKIMLMLTNNNDVFKFKKQNNKLLLIDYNGITTNQEYTIIQRNDGYALMSHNNVQYYGRYRESKDRAMLTIDKYYNPVITMRNNDLVLNIADYIMNGNIHVQNETSMAHEMNSLVKMMNALQSDECLIDVNTCIYSMLQKDYSLPTIIYELNNIYLISRGYYTRQNICDLYCVNVPVDLTQYTKLHEPPFMSRSDVVVKLATDKKLYYDMNQIERTWNTIANTLTSRIKFEDYVSPYIYSDNTLEDGTLMLARIQSNKLYTARIYTSYMYGGSLHDIVTNDNDYTLYQQQVMLHKLVNIPSPGPVTDTVYAQALTEIASFGGKHIFKATDKIYSVKARVQASIMNNLRKNINQYKTSYVERLVKKPIKTYKLDTTSSLIEYNTRWNNLYYMLQYIYEYTSKFYNKGDLLKQKSDIKSLALVSCMELHDASTPDQVNILNNYYNTFFKTKSWTNDTKHSTFYDSIYNINTILSMTKQQMNTVINSIQSKLEYVRANMGELPVITEIKHSNKYDEMVAAKQELNAVLNKLYGIKESSIKEHIKTMDTTILNIVAYEKLHIIDAQHVTAQARAVYDACYTYMNMRVIEMFLTQLSRYTNVINEELDDAKATLMNMFTTKGVHSRYVNYRNYQAPNMNDVLYHISTLATSFNEFLAAILTINYMYTGEIYNYGIYTMNLIYMQQLYSIDDEKELARYILDIANKYKNKYDYILFIASKPLVPEFQAAKYPDTDAELEAEKQVTYQVDVNEIIE